MMVMKTLLIFLSITCTIVSGALVPCEHPQQNQEFLDQLEAIPPFAINIFSQYDATTQTVPEARGGSYSVSWNGNGNAPVLETETGFNAVNPVTSLYGKGNTQLRWPQTLASTFTVCWATRYHSMSDARNRILTTTSGNSFFGHFAGHRGMMRYNGETFQGAEETSGAPVTDWLIACFTNARNGADGFIIDQTNWGDDDETEGSTTRLTLGLNTHSGQTSHYNIHSVYVWHSALTGAQMRKITAGIRIEMGGVPCFETAPVVAINNIRAYNMRFLLATRPPQSIHIFSDFSGTAIPNRMGSGFHATVTAGTATLVTTTGVGNGVVNPITSLSGGVSTKLLWPEYSIPTIMTVCSVSRYSGGTSDKIFNCYQSPTQDSNWFHGHWASRRGVAVHNGGWKTGTVTVGVHDDWLVMCGSSSPVSPGQIVIDQTNVGTGYISNIKCRLHINIEGPSAFEVHSLYIWNAELSNFHMKQVTTALRGQLGGIPDFESNPVVPMDVSGTSSAYCAGVEVVQCPRGYFINGVDTSCTVCPVDTYKSTVGPEACSSCPSNLNSPAGSEALTDCVCVPGYRTVGTGACTLCAMDVYCMGGVQTACPINTYSPTGSDELSDCSCDGGYFRY
jgi:hypothetical protein